MKGWREGWREGDRERDEERQRHAYIFKNRENNAKYSNCLKSKRKKYFNIIRAIQLIM